MQCMTPIAEFLIDSDWRYDVFGRHPNHRTTRGTGGSGVRQWFGG
jgi:hypothetical protein